MAPLLRVFPSLLPVLALVRPISSSRILREGLVERRFEAELDHFGFGWYG